MALISTQVVRAGEEVFIADPVTQWPKSGVKQTLVDNLDTKFMFTYKFVYGNNLNADGATEDDDARRGVLRVASISSTLPVRAQVPIVRADPVSKKKKSDSGIDLGLAIGVLIAAVILAFCCGAVRGPRPSNTSRRWRIRPRAGVLRLPPAQGRPRRRGERHGDG